MDEFTKIVLNAFGPLIGHHQGLLACVRGIFLKSFENLIEFCILNSSASQFYSTLGLSSFIMP